MQRTLLIVDNLESVIDDRVRIFLRNLPAPTKCIITSREWVDVADVLKLVGLPAEEAEKMIIEEVATRDVKLNEVQRQQLFKRTSGLPLPIKLSLARMASGETFNQIIRWLGNATGDLPIYCIKGQIDMVHRLDLNAWKLLLACSLFDHATGASRETLGSITDLSLADRDDGLTTLQRLSLLNHTEEDRFWILLMIQKYVGVELITADFSEALTERWLEWLLQFTQLYGIGLDLHIERAQIVGSEYPNLLNAIRWCREHEQWETLLQLAEGSWFYPYLVGLFSEYQEILEAAVQAAKSLSHKPQEGRFTRRLALPFWVQGQHEKALEYLDKAEEIALRYSDDFELGQVRSLRAVILSDQGHLLEAEKLDRNVLEIGERLNNIELKALSAYSLSRMESKKQHFDKALEWLDQRENWCRELGWTRGLAWSMYRRGDSLIQQGNSAAAELYLEQSLSMATSWSERRLIAHIKHRLIQVYMHTGRLQLACQMAEEARDLCDRLGMVVELTEVEELLRKLPDKNGNE